MLMMSPVSTVLRVEKIFSYKIFGYWDSLYEEYKNNLCLSQLNEICSLKKLLGHNINQKYRKYYKLHTYNISFGQKNSGNLVNSLPPYPMWELIHPLPE